MSVLGRMGIHSASTSTAVSVVIGIDADELCTSFLGLKDVIANAARACPCGVGSHHHDGFAVPPVEAVVDGFGPPSIAHHERVLDPGTVAVGAPIDRATARDVQGFHDFGVGYHGSCQNRVVPVVVPGVLDLGGNVVQRLVPADAFPFVLAAQRFVAARQRLPMLPLHGVFQPVGGKHLLAQGTPAQAPALLDVIGAVLMRVVRFLANDDPVLDEGFVQAAPAAHFPASHRFPHAPAFGARGALVGVGRFLEAVPTSGQADSRCGNRADLQERPSVQREAFFLLRHTFPLT